MKKYLIVITTVLLSVGVLLTGCSKYTQLKKVKIPKNVDMHTHQPKEPDKITSFNAVPIKDDKHGNLKPRSMKVYLKKGDDVLDITKFGKYHSSDKKHLFGSWVVTINQDKFNKMIKDKDVYYEVMYAYGQSRWYKVKK